MARFEQVMLQVVSAGEILKAISVLNAMASDQSADSPQALFVDDAEDDSTPALSRPRG